MWWRNIVGLKFQIVAEAGMRWSRGNSEAFLGWYKLYREALVYRGIKGEELNAMLRKALEPDLL